MGLAGSTSKQQEPSEPEETTVFEDRISNLPEPLLCHILSFLTTKEAFATSILSSRWKTLWTLVPILDLDDSDIELALPYFSIGSWISRSENHHQNRHRVSFADIMSRVWVLRNANPFPLQKIRLHWHCHRDSIDVDTWVHTAISRGFLQELDLEVSLRQPLNITSTLFNYATPLVVLKLGGSIVINPPSSSSSSSSSTLGFPTLKVLHLHSVDYANHDSFWRFLTCCPVLQDLSIKSFSGNCPCNFKIIVPTLKILHLHFLHLSYELEINTPALEHIHFKGQLSKDVLLTNLSNVVDAVVIESLYISLDLEEFGNRVGDFIRALSNVKSLHLDSFTTHCLYNASEFDPPVFHNLALLKFDDCTYCWHGLLPLLRQSPNLEALLLQKIPADHEEKTSIFEWMVTSSHLKTIYFKGFDGSMDELKFVRDVLKEASFLETMKLYSSSLNLEEKLHVLQKLLMFPRKSSTCQIAFI